MFRTTAALAGGLVRELGDVALPASLRQTRLYQSLVGITLRFLIEQVGQVEGAYPSQSQLAQDFLARRAAGNGIEFVGILLFRASPVWVMAALADLSGAGRSLIQQIAASLKKEGLLDPASEFETVDQMLDGLERTSGRMAEAFNSPPLDVAGLRREWQILRENAASIPPRALPGIASLTRQWEDLQKTADTQHRSVFEVSALMAVSAIGALPDNVRWLSRCAHTAAWATSELFAGAILDHYANTLRAIHREGYLSYWTREFRPYLAAAAHHFSPSRESLTERLLWKRGRSQ